MTTETSRTRTAAPAPVDDTAERRPARRWWLVGLAALGGFLLSVAWSAEFVDQEIGANVAGTLLGHDGTAPITGIVAGVVFAFVSGLAGTFTACNVAIFGAVAPLIGGATGRWGRLVAALRPLGWLATGTLVVSASYGALVGLVGTGMPQFSTAKGGPGSIPPALVQSMVVFGLIGLALLWLGLAAAQVVPDPLARLTARHPNTPMVVMGVLIGGFLIGRPFPLFREMFRHAADSGNPLYGAAAFCLQSLGNLLVLAILFIVLSMVGGARLQRWFTADRRRLAAVTTVALVLPAVFVLLYWDVRLPASFDLIPWYPIAPWAG
ncbi:MAG TPA: hypothetical protein VGP36_24375 [Mycobacteriales bacterium]|jgi:hypothetical protein|nr:hypothetical protein [Mycobacteriales bacterium]